MSIQSQKPVSYRILLGTLAITLGSLLFTMGMYRLEKRHHAEEIARLEAKYANDQEFLALNDQMLRVCFQAMERHNIGMPLINEIPKYHPETPEDLRDKLRGYAKMTKYLEQRLAIYEAASTKRQSRLTPCDCPLTGDIEADKIEK